MKGVESCQIHEQDLGQKDNPMNGHGRVIVSYKKHLKQFVNGRGLCMSPEGFIYVPTRNIIFQASCMSPEGFARTNLEHHFSNFFTKV